MAHTSFADTLCEPILCQMHMMYTHEYAVEYSVPYYETQILLVYVFSNIQQALWVDKYVRAEQDHLLSKYRHDLRQCMKMSLFFLL